MTFALHRPWVSLVPLVLILTPSLGCKNKAPKQQERPSKVRVDTSPCALLVNEMCTQCGEISEPCNRLRKSPPSRQAQCVSAQKILNGKSTTARTYDGYCGLAAWVAADVNRTSRRGASSEPAACRRFSFEVCRLCGHKSSACTNLRRMRASTGAACEKSVTALLRPRKHKLCQLDAGWKALKLTPTKPKITP